MFWFRKKKLSSNIIGDMVREFPDDLLKCEECKHMVERRDMQVVIEHLPGGFLSRGSVARLYYCPTHVKKYAVVRYVWVRCKEVEKCVEEGYEEGYPEEHHHQVKCFFKEIPAHELRLNEDGTEYKAPEKKVEESAPAPANA